ncbi:MAG: aminotransferase class IV, partial [Nitrospinae bacterium]|nr:aminotransferase class IV [Nitrospinota bacterium]
MKIYIDGKYYDKAEAKVSVFDHGLLYGDGILEGIRIYNGKIFRLKEHIERLYESAKALLLQIPMTKEEMEAALQDAVKVNERKDGYIRLMVTRGEGSLGLDPASCKRATVIIIVDTIQLYPKEYYEKGITVITASSRRIPSVCLDPRIKSLNYLNNIMAKLEAKQAGCLEAVMLNTEGFVAECTADNIFIVKG